MPPTPTVRSHFVSWGDAARFANWLHNGQPTGAQDLTTTEDGSYYIYGATSRAALITVVRRPDATWVIPTEDEWYKAAYHKNDGVTANYFDYPTSNDSAPGYVNDGGDLSGTGTPFTEGDTDLGNYATYDGDGGTDGIGDPYYRTEVGEWENSHSPYGTFDQGGNVWEWNEAVIGSWRGLRGVSFSSGDVALHASYRSSVGPAYEVSAYGFRVSDVSTPGDMDGDGDVDRDDLTILTPCLSGPGVAPGGACDGSDIDGDGDCDMADFAGFQQQFTGPVEPPVGACCYAGGVCVVETEAECAGTWRGAGTTCDSNPCPAPVVMETITVGNADNAGELSGDSAGGYGPDRICGAVDYTYNIGKYEVTAGQYAAFLNAVAATDTYGLYNTNMWSHDYGCKIRQLGSWGSLSYVVDHDGDGVEDADWVDRPVNFVSWGDAARFANWLHNGQPTGAQDLTTTEDGSYYLNGTTTNAELFAVTRHEQGATWVIPTEDEWYKAAYHKNDGVTGNYFDYPTSSDSVPSNQLINPDPGNNATFYAGSYTIGSPYWRTEVGAHENSDSPYGTFDQGGNVCEWNEAILYGSQRGSRGGLFLDIDFVLHASARDSRPPTDEGGYIGFRVAELP